MDLATETQARIPAPRLKQLTNGQSPGTANTINATVLADAVLDASTDFELYAEQVYDGADQRHITIGVKGVIAYLQSYIGQDGEGKAVKQFQDRLTVLRNTTSRARIDPFTTSNVEPTPDPVDSNGISRPEFDTPHFDNLVPKQMGRSVSSDNAFWSDDE